MHVRTKHNRRDLWADDTAAVLPRFRPGLLWARAGADRPVRGGGASAGCSWTEIGQRIGADDEIRPTMPLSAVVTAALRLG